MASSAQYAYQKPSTIATRALVTGAKPAETPSASSHDVDTAQDRPVLQRQTTDHYQQAVQQAEAANPGQDSTARPVLDRQQSWKHADLKRGAMEKILSGQSTEHGYTSTSTAK